MKLKPSQITESAAELKKMLRKTPIGHEKQRLTALYIFCSGQAKTYKQVAEMIGVNRRTIGIWFQTYAAEGLDSLLTRKYSSGRPSHLTKEQQELLRSKLNEPGGFSSYQEIVDYIEKTFDVKMNYKAVYAMVRYKWKAKLKVPRKSHIKKNEKACEEFKQNFTETLKTAVSDKDQAFERIRVCYQDETRFGLHPVSYRRITLPGIKPIAKISYTYDNFYLYGAVEPLTGESFFLEMPSLNSECFQIFLDEFAKVNPSSLNILILDNGRFHHAKSLQIPENVMLLFLPPYSPELNPIERLWQDVKAKLFKNVFASIKEMQDKLTQILKNYTEETITSITNYYYITESLNEM